MSVLRALPRLAWWVLLLGLAGCSDAHAQSKRYPWSKGGGGTGQAGWTTIVDVNFAGEASRTLSTDGNYTIAGLVFKKENSANDATPMALVSGQGLVVQPVAATDVNGGTRTAPMLFLPFSSIGGATLDEGTLIRVLVAIPSDTLAADSFASFENEVVGVGADGSNVWTYMIARGSGASSQSMALIRFVNNANSNNTNVSMTLGASNQAIMLYLPSLLATHYSGLVATLSAGAFPVTSSFAPKARFLDAAAQATDLSILNSVSDMRQWGVFVGAIRGGSTHAFSATFSRLRVDIR